MATKSSLVVAWLPAAMAFAPQILDSQLLLLLVLPKIAAESSKPNFRTTLLLRIVVHPLEVATSNLARMQRISS